MSEEGTCDGNCGTELENCLGYWGVMTPTTDELDFCSLDCMRSWLDAER